MCAYHTSNHQNENKTQVCVCGGALPRTFSTFRYINWLVGWLACSLAGFIVRLCRIPNRQRIYAGNPGFWRLKPLIVMHHCLEGELEKNWQVKKLRVNHIKIKKTRCLNKALTIVVESTHLKNMFVKLDDVNKYRWKSKNIWNHHPGLPCDWY